METIEIDGSEGEGGGSILRLAAACSIIFQKRIEVFNIRANRKVPGLRAQHLTGLEALAELSNGKLEGGRVKSTEIIFTPGKISPKEINLTISTAGSIGLLFQVLSIACCKAEIKDYESIKVNVSGGATFGKWAPASSYIINVICPLLRKMGYNTLLEVKKHGFYPKGGASAIFTFKSPKELQGLHLDERGEVTIIEGESIASYHLKKPSVASRQKKACGRRLSNNLGVNNIDIRDLYVDALNPGSGITCWAKTTTGCIISSGTVIGERGKPSEKVGGECASSLLKILTKSPAATVDEFTSDQLIPFLMLSDHESSIIAPELTSHAHTNLDLISKFNKRAYSIIKHENHVSLKFPKN